MIKSIKILSLPVPTRSENFNLFFQSLERAFLTKKINDEYKSEILINLLGERAHNVLLYIKEEELNDYEKLKSIVLREFQLTPRECLNSFKNAVKSSGETYIQFAARLTANFQYYCSLRKVNSFESLCDLIISDKLYETLNKETATHIGIREAEDWFRPIDLAKECDIYISSRSGSHKEIPITYGYTQDPFKNRSQNFKPKVKENYPQYHERENKNCYICGDSSHCARDCEKRFKSKESNDHIHNRINVNTLKIESEKQNSDECANLQYVNIFVENQPVTALIDSGCQIPVLNSSLIRVQTPSEEIITLSSCFGEQRMVEVKPINISLNQHSPSLSVRTAISPTLTEEFIMHPSVYSEIEKLGHAKSDVLLSESGSSLSADCGVSFPNVSVSNVIENSSYDLSHVKNFNTRNDSSSLIKDYKLLCKKANGAMKTSSVEFISRSPNPLPMKSEHRRFSSGLHGNTAADSVQSEWPLWHAAKSKTQVFARRRIEFKLKQKLLDIRAEKEGSKKGERERYYGDQPSFYNSVGFSFMDITPYDFWLWGFLKDNIYRQRPANPQGLKDSIWHYVLDIPADLLRAVFKYIVLRFEHIVEDGYHIDQVPSHCGLWGNERADFLAKKGTGILQNFRRDLTLHSAKLEIKRIFRESFRLTASRVAGDKPWSTLRKKSHGIPSSPRAAAAAKFRLLTGHDCLCAHLFRFNLVTSPICVLCDTGQDMTAAHLDECSALNDLNCIVKRYWRARCLMT
ncbi:retrovirus-related Pol polyprotein from transposon opus [Trichonephila clavipes]|nr:retrovirus-related Pol polyprotein from transposon opus [Trichonephila clavipes]